MNTANETLINNSRPKIGLAGSAPQPERGVHAASRSEYLPGKWCRGSAVISTLKRAEARAPQRECSRAMRDALQLFADVTDAL